jgi:tetratricopeptide (TPR) repeat protein
MGRIADSVLDLLADGPLDAERLGQALAEAGVTRSRDPGSAVRQAIRDDPRVIQLGDGRFASVARALTGVELVTVLGADAIAAGQIEIEPDLALLAVLDLGPTLPLPAGAQQGEAVVVRIADAAARSVEVVRAAVPGPHPADEAALLSAVEARLGRRRSGGRPLVPPITHLGTVAAGVAASSPGALRAAGRPMGVVLADAGFEVHLGWVGRAGTAWSSLTEEEIDALEADVAELLAAERTAEAVRVQARLLSVLGRHVPERVPAARRHLARILARAGRFDQALAQLREAFSQADPEDWYEASLIAFRCGDERSARRWVESGLAHSDDPGRAEVAECLADIGDDLDAQAAFLRCRSLLEDEAIFEDDGPARIARAIVGLRRSYLIEAMVEEILGALPPGEVGALLSALADAGDAGRDACRAIAAILPPGADRTTAEGFGQGAPTRIPAVAGLVNARAAAAWATSPFDAPDQQQIVITVAKERGRVSPLVALIDLDQLGGGVKDAFFLPDMIEPRLRRELFVPMEEMGLPSEPVDLHEAIALVQAALGRTAAVGWRIPSLQHQPVLDRIERWLLRPQRGDAGRRPVAGP